MRPPLLSLALLVVTGCVMGQDPGTLRGPLATFDELRPAPAVIDGPTAILFWLASADTLPAPAWSDAGHSLASSLVELRSW
jgi:hypothetical protein